DIIVRQITNPRMGVMPAWHTRLDEAMIKSLTLYVHSLGGGE
ncbi:MAG TPA: cytochrome C oxidase Cbb3, partial [Acetobacteraceae bacterium]|nr:cytochrome C oxidase Cbb3 [Acetobacteraceae bacterium]